MRKSISFMLSMAFVAASGAALAQSGITANQASTSAQVVSLNSQTPVMSHEVASLMQIMQKAQAQYRKTGQSQDLARVEAMRHELASRGFGRVTVSVPAMVADRTETTPLAGDMAVRVSSAAL